MKKILPMGLYPIQEVDFYPNGYARVRRRYVGKSEPIHGIRQSITEMSHRSKKRMVWKMYQADVNWRTMTMLSYPKDYEKDGEQVKTHLGKMLGWWRYKALASPSIVSRETFYYCWFLEFQTRGAAHIHVITNFDYDAIWDSAFPAHSAKKWADIVIGETMARGASFEEASQFWEEYDKVCSFHRHHKNWQQIRESDGAIRYAAKYAAKSAQKIVPKGYKNVGRFWGISRNCPEKQAETLTMDEQELRDLLIGLGHPASDWEILPKHLYNMQT